VSSKNIRNVSFIFRKLIFYDLIDKRKPTAGVGCLEFVMNNEKELERGIIPAGTRIKLYEGSITLLEDVAVNADQEWIDRAIKDQDDYHLGLGSVGDKSPMSSANQ